MIWASFSSPARALHAATHMVRNVVAFVHGRKAVERPEHSSRRRAPLCGFAVSVVAAL